MTKQEAKQALEDGFKIAHRNFFSDEFIFRNNGVLTDEGGIQLDEEDFWRYRQDPVYDNNWDIFDPSLTNF